MPKVAFDQEAWMPKRNWKIIKMREFTLSYGSYLSLFDFKTCWIVGRHGKKEGDPIATRSWRGEGRV
jgi:hypothetical protein